MRYEQNEGPHASVPFVFAVEFKQLWTKQGIIWDTHCHHCFFPEFSQTAVQQ